MNSKLFLFIKWLSALGMVAVYYVLTVIVFFWETEGMSIANGGGRTTIFLFSLLYCLLLVLMLYFLEAFQIGKRRILDIVFGFFVSSVCVNFAVWILSIVFSDRSASKSFFIYVALVVVQNIIGFCWVMFCHKVYERFQFRREAVFVYGNREDEAEYTQVNNTINKYFTISRSLNYNIGMEQIMQEIQASSVVFLGDIPVEDRNRLIKLCMGQRIECYSVPKISDIYIQNATIMQLHDKILLRYPQLGITGARRVLKRFADIVVSALMLAVFSPVMLIIVLAIKHDDDGPIFYYQDRVTEGGRPFKMCKFRSMRTDAEKNGMTMAVKDDDRVTRVGKKIRNIHFDELPQLINVLRGDMSLVGPRPERKEFIDMYAEKIPEFPERLLVKGGLTGYAQIYGRYNSEPEDKIKYDLYYIYNYSLRLDIKILILTIRILFQKENTTGFDEEQIEAIRERSRGNNNVFAKVKKKQ